MPVVPLDEDSRAQLLENGVRELLEIIRVLLQTLFFGIYTILMIYLTHKMWRKKQEPNSRTRRLMFYMIAFMFGLSLVYWGVSVAGIIHRTTNRFITLVDESVEYPTLFNAIMGINYFLADGVVVWRAWVLCRDGAVYRRLLWASMVLLICTGLTTALIIGMRSAIFAHAGKKSMIDTLMNGCQVTALVLSFLTNVLATSAMGLKTRRYWRWIREELKMARAKNTRSEKIMLLLIESGVLYCISGASAIAFTLIRLPRGTLGDIYHPVNVQMAGMYPMIVLLAVEHQRKQGVTVFENRTRQSVPRSQMPEIVTIQFADSNSRTVDA